MSQRILIAGTAENTRVELQEILSGEGYTVETVGEASAAIDRVQSNLYDALLLDLDIPARSGLDVLRIVQDTSPQTRVILFAPRRTVQSALKAIRTRVVDYLLLPVNRVQVIRAVRRAFGSQTWRQAAETPGSYSTDQLALPYVVERADGVRIDLNRRAIQWGSDSLRLTASETRLLRAFLQNPGRVLSHAELVRQVQGFEASEVEAPLILRPLVSRLRQKLVKVPGGESWVVNIRGTGYMYERRAQLGD